MHSTSNAFNRSILFGLIACLLFWLGTHRPKAVSSGPSLVVVTQGNNVSFEPQSFQSSLFSVTKRGGLTNASQATTNAASR
jgi:hypothetical protein